VANLQKEVWLCWQTLYVGCGSLTELSRLHSSVGLHMAQFNPSFVKSKFHYANFSKTSPKQTTDLDKELSRRSFGDCCNVSENWLSLQQQLSLSWTSLQQVRNFSETSPTCLREVLRKLQTHQWNPCNGIWPQSWPRHLTSASKRHHKLSVQYEEIVE